MLKCFRAPNTEYHACVEHAEKSEIPFRSSTADKPPKQCFFLAEGRVEQRAGVSDLMMVSMTTIQAAALLLLLTVTCSSSFSLPPPSYGDIKLDDNGVVLIYTEHDYNHHEDNVWMAIDFYNSQHREELTETLCHQLGYSDGILSGKVLDTTLTQYEK